VGVLFSLENISFDEQKLFSFMRRSHLSMLSLSCCAAGVSLRKFYFLKKGKLQTNISMNIDIKINAQKDISK
jgi:hypothetical protein